MMVTLQHIPEAKTPCVITIARDGGTPASFGVASIERAMIEALVRVRNAHDRREAIRVEVVERDTHRTVCLLVTRGAPLTLEGEAAGAPALPHLPV